jgi:hypothetical protein
MIAGTPTCAFTTDQLNRLPFANLQKGQQTNNNNYNTSIEEIAFQLHRARDRSRIFKVNVDENSGYEGVDSVGHNVWRKGTYTAAEKAGSRQ